MLDTQNTERATTSMPLNLVLAQQLNVKEAWEIGNTAVCIYADPLNERRRTRRYDQGRNLSRGQKSFG